MRVGRRRGTRPTPPPTRGPQRATGRGTRRALAQRLERRSTQPGASQERCGSGSRTARSRPSLPVAPARASLPPGLATAVDIDSREDDMTGASGRVVQSEVVVYVRRRGELEVVGDHARAQLMQGVDYAGVDTARGRPAQVERVQRVGVEGDQ